jgi:hypothetical protein
MPATLPGTRNYVYIKCILKYYIHIYIVTITVEGNVADQFFTLTPLISPWPVLPCHDLTNTV